MALSEFELFKIEKAWQAFAAKYPSFIPDQGMQYRLEGHAMFVFERRPALRDPSTLIESPIAKITWVGTQKHWRLSWMRATLKWSTYEPNPTHRAIESALAEVAADPYGCFFG